MIATRDDDWSKLEDFPKWQFCDQLSEHFSFPSFTPVIERYPLREFKINHYQIAFQDDTPIAAEFYVYHYTDEALRQKCSMPNELNGNSDTVKIDLPELLKQENARKYWIRVEVHRFSSPKLYGYSVHEEEPCIEDCKLLLLSCPWYGLSNSASWHPGSSNVTRLGENFKKRQLET